MDNLTSLILTKGVMIGAIYALISLGFNVILHRRNQLCAGGGS